MIIPAILEETFEKIKSKISIIESVVDSIQIDIADGILVTGKTFLDIFKLKELETNLDLELHLMVTNPIIYLREKIPNVKKISAHIETPTYVENFIYKSKDLGYSTGLSINPETEIEKLAPYVTLVDFIQFLAVVPGKQESEFIPSVLDKIKEFKMLYPDVITQIDGGINENNLEGVLQTKVNNVVIGSAIFKSEDPKEAYLKLSAYDK